MLFAQQIQYSYDAAGNRICRKGIYLKDSIVSDYTNKFIEKDTSKFQIDDNFSDIKIKIYPNPFSTSITLKTSESSNTIIAYYELFSQNGQCLVKNKINNFPQEINLSGLSNGEYILKLQVNNKDKEYLIIKN
jgi:hypothetical protein